MREKLKSFWFRLKIFIWFLTTEPLRQLKDIMRSLLKVIESLNRAITWIYIALGLLIFFLFIGNNFAAGIFLIFLLIIVIAWEWQRGYFMHKYRTEVKKRTKEKYKDLIKEGKEKNDEYNNHNTKR